MENLKLLPALIAAKSEFGSLGKDKKGNYGKYVSLDAVLAAVEPALLNHGLLITHKIDEGFLITCLYHSSGEFMASNIKLPEVLDPQKIGSALTYYRRYSICCLLSICADEDDDGQSSSDYSKKRSHQTASPVVKAMAAISAREADVVIDEISLVKKEVVNLIKEIGWTEAQSKEWASKFSQEPKQNWPLSLWQKAREKLMHVLDDAVQTWDLVGEADNGCLH